LKEVDIELGIIETKLLGLKHAPDVNMLFGYKIQDSELQKKPIGHWLIAAVGGMCRNAAH